MRPLTARIRLDHLAFNYRLARARHGGPVLATLKANAYGHGAVQCALHLEPGADGFAVACLEEALALREAGIRKPILLLNGVFEASELAEVERHDLWIVVSSTLQVAMLLQSQARQPFRVWLKMDTGMHRAGLAPNIYCQAWDQLVSSGKVGAIVLMSHFASANKDDRQETRWQIERFQSTIADLPGEVSLANSAGLLAHPLSRRGWARAGIMLYGASPLDRPDGVADALKPVMALKSRVFSVRIVPAGDSIGYGSAWVVQRPTRAGLVACGYADGYPRAASGAFVAVNGRLARVIGPVSMDTLTLDLTDLPDAGIGSEVELWGDQIPVSRVATQAQTISYELLCNVKRARFEYV
jgi:alanine racemase